MSGVVDLKEVKFPLMNILFLTKCTKILAILGMWHRATPDNLLFDEVNNNEVLVGGVEEGQEGEREARSDGEELPNLLVDVRRAYLMATCAIYGDDVSIA